MSIDDLIKLVNRKTSTVNEMRLHNRDMKRVINAIRGFSDFAMNVRKLIQMRIEDNNEDIEKLQL